MLLKKPIILMIICTIVLFTGCSNKNVVPTQTDNQPDYYDLASPETIIKNGSQGEFDAERAHTLSVVELNKNGYRFWGYYTGYNGTNIKNDQGLVYSNDMKNWTKDKSNPVIPNLRWGTAVVVDGIVNLFGTRNYGSDSYIVRLVSENGKDFKEVETVVNPVKGRRNQNPFMFYDETEGTYRLYYFYSVGKKNFIMEKHSSSISQLASAKPSIVTLNTSKSVAAPSVVYRDGIYWLTVESLDVEKNIWKTLAFYSTNPVKGYKPVGNSELLVNNDACYFPYIFDNKLNGFYSHAVDDKTWIIANRTHDFKDKNTISVDSNEVNLKSGDNTQIKASIKYADGSTKDITSLATWATSDNTATTVKRGCIAAQKNGSAIVTVSYGGCSTTINVKIGSN